MRHPEARPAWVKHNGKMVNVSEFAHLTRSTRPIVYCPVCEQRAILKLGNKNVHHYAHQASETNEIDCPTTKPETALHWNMKFYIQDILQYASQIIIKNHCRTCNKSRIEVFLQGWDNLEVEYRLGDYILDVAFLKNGVCIGAIEVYVTHQVDRQKFDFLQQNNIPLLEIEGETSFYAGKDAWNFDKPMPYIQVSPTRENWTCESCQDESEVKKITVDVFTAKQHIQAMELASFSYTVQLGNTSNNIPLQAFKIIDIFYPSGEMKREIYIRDNDELRLESGELISHGSEDFMLYLLNVRLADRKRYFNAIIDKVTEWMPLEQDNEISNFGQNYNWNTLNQSWHKK